MKKLLTIVLFCAVCLMTQARGHDYSFKCDGLYYTITGPTTVEVTYKDRKGKGYKKLTEAVVPSQVKHKGKTYTVTRIGGYAFNWGTSVLKSISLPNTITTIEEWAFHGCRQLRTIVLPSSVVSVGDFSFMYSGLKSVTFNEGLTSIGKCAFSIVDLQEIVLPQSLKSIGDEAFLYCRNLKSVTIPVGVSRMGKRVFEDCDRLCSIAVPGSVGRIGDYTFKGCKALKHVVLEDGVSSLGEGVFDGCDSLMHVSLPGSMKRINTSLFMGKQFLETVSLPYGVEEIGRSAFNGCVSLTSVELPSSLKRIGECAFSECKSLTQVFIPASVERIAYGAFDGCDDLKVICCEASEGSYQNNWNGSHRVVYGVKYIVGDLAFSDEDCDKGTVKVIGYVGASDNYAVSIPEVVQIDGEKFFVTEIGDKAFFQTGIREVNMPSSVRRVGEQAFANCSNLERVSIPASVTAIENDAFKNSHARVECELTRKNHKWDWEPEEGKVTWGTVELPEFDYEVFAEGKVSLVSYNGTATRVVIPSEVTQDGKTYSVTHIGGAAFIHTQVEEVEIPNTVRAISALSFCDCQNLRGITLPDSLLKIGGGAFFGCWQLRDVKLGVALDEIGESAFVACSALKEIHLPPSVKAIGDDAFRRCDSLVIHCALDDTPGDTWEDNWNGNRPVVFNADDVFEDYEFIANGQWHGVREKAAGNVVIPPLFDDIMAFPLGCVCVVSTFAFEGKTLMLPGRVILSIKYDGEIVNKDFSELISSSEAPNTVALCFAREFGFKDLEAYLTLKNSENLVEQGRLKEAYDAAMKAYRINPEMKDAAEYANAIDEVIKENARREELRRLEEEERRRAEEAERRAAAERARQAQAERSQAIINGLNQISAALNNTAQQMQQISQMRQGNRSSTSYSQNGRAQSYGSSATSSGSSSSSGGGTSTRSSGNSQKGYNGSYNLADKLLEDYRTEKCHTCHDDGKCFICNGRGKNGRQACTKCGGSGKCRACRSNEIKTHICNLCNGWGTCTFCTGGKVNGMVCDRCHGTDICKRCNGAKVLKGAW